MSVVEPVPVNEVVWGRIPYEQYARWEDKIRTSLENIKDLTQDIFATGNAGVVSEMISKYSQWNPLFTRYKSYLDNRENYCKVLDNGFHVYEPIEFREFGYRDYYVDPKPAHCENLSGLALHKSEYNQDEVRDGGKFHQNGIAESIEQIEQYFAKVHAYEQEFNIPVGERLVSENNVVTVSALNDGSDSRGEFLYRVPLYVREQSIYDRELYSQGINFRWTVSTLL